MRDGLRWVGRGIVVAFVLLGTGACNFQRSKMAQPQVGALPLAFSTVRDAILEPHCAHCHGVGKSDSEGGSLLLSTYQGLFDEKLVVAGDAAASTLYRVLESGDMPKDHPMSKELVAFVGRWIDAGAPETADGPVAPIDPIDPVDPIDPPPPAEKKLLYADIAKLVLEPYCIRCHKGDKPAGKLDLTTYANIFAPVKPVVVPGDADVSRLYTLVLADKMPTRGDKVPAELKEKLRLWIAQGALESAPVEEVDEDSFQ